MRDSEHRFRFRATAVFALLFAGFCQGPPANSSAEQTAVSAEIRLRDYLKYSQYPDFSRPADVDSPEIEEMRPSHRLASGAQVTGWGIPRQVGGSLVIPFQVDVRSAGRYAFSTLAKELNQRKFAVLTKDAEMKVGTHTLEFILFGKMFRDRGSVPVLILEGIAGERIPTEKELEAAASTGQTTEGRLELFRRSLRIEALPADAFSAAEWNSPEKQNRIAELKAEVDAQNRAAKQP